MPPEFEVSEPPRTEFPVTFRDAARNAYFVVIVAFAPAIGSAMSTLIAVVQVDEPLKVRVLAAKTCSRCVVSAPVAHVRVPAAKFTPMLSVDAVMLLSPGVLTVRYAAVPDPRALQVRVVTPCKREVPPVPTVSAVSVPTLVSDDAVTPLAKVFPERVPAGAITTVVPTAVVSPFALTVKTGIAVEEPNEPTFPLTVASVVAFPLLVTSPVKLAFVVTVPAVRLAAVPEILVPVNDDGVPPAPLNVTNAPALPTFMPSAVRTPVPVVVVAGAVPAPPPITIAFAARAPEVAHVVVLLKYGIPPEVPAMVNAGVVVGFATETIPPVQPTVVTVPDPLPEVSSVPPLNDSPGPTAISSSAPVPEVVRPTSLVVAIVRPLFSTKPCRAGTGSAPGILFLVLHAEFAQFFKVGCSTQNSEITVVHFFWIDCAGWWHDKTAGNTPCPVRAVRFCANNRRLHWRNNAMPNAYPRPPCRSGR